MFSSNEQTAWPTLPYLSRPITLIDVYALSNISIYFLGLFYFPYPPIKYIDDPKVVPVDLIGVTNYLN